MSSVRRESSVQKKKGKKHTMMVMRKAVKNPREGKLTRTAYAVMLAGAQKWGEKENRNGVRHKAVGKKNDTDR